AGINFDVQNFVSYLKETFISLTFCCSVFKVHYILQPLIEATLITLSQTTRAVNKLFFLLAVSIS
ncbi:hypothetical protein ACQKMN_16855, partial [Ureibacillus composti]